MRFWDAFAVRFIAFLLVFSSIAGLFVFSAFLSGDFSALQTKPTGAVPEMTIVLDAGHGGEDGGACAADGTCEKDINLSITLYLRDFLVAAGVPVVLTRSEDIMLYDKNIDYHGRKKLLDLTARKDLAESTENAVFVSIHMNAFPQPRYSGLQVWYSPNHSDGASLANTIQDYVRENLQPENNRETKAAGSSIFLLHRLTCPAVLVECGFLSNPEEAKRLQEEDYQKEIAFALFLSILSYREKSAPVLSTAP